jgi:hypothetical protein
MHDTIETTVICPKCDAAFTLSYSRYAHEKTHTCSVCGTSIPLPENPPSSGQPELATAPHRRFFASWITENRYMLCGVVCLLVAVVSMAITLTAADIYIPLSCLALVFGVLAVMDRKPIQGLLLILAITILGSLLGNYLIEKRTNEESQKFNNQMQKTLDALRGK